MSIKIISFIKHNPIFTAGTAGSLSGTALMAAGVAAIFFASSPALPFALLLGGGCVIGLSLIGVSVAKCIIPNRDTKKWLEIFSEHDLERAELIARTRSETDPARQADLEKEWGVMFRIQQETTASILTNNQNRSWYQ